MKIAVWDTYVKRDDDSIMHFDIIVPSEVNNEQAIFSFGMDYLKTKPFQTNQLSANECRLCHIEYATEDMITSIEKNGYSIIEMENCN